MATAGSNIAVIREYGRVVSDWAGGGDPTCLLDQSVMPGEFKTSGITQNRPAEYSIWVVTLEQPYTDRGIPTGEVVLNLRKWVHSRPSKKNPDGYEGPVRTEFGGGITLTSEVAMGLGDAFARAAADIPAEKERVAAEGGQDTSTLLAQIAALNAKLAAAQVAK